MEETKELPVATVEAPQEEKKPKAWPASANAWQIGKKVVVQDLYGKGIKSCLVVNHSPNYLAVLKAGGAFSKFQKGTPVKVGENVFFVAERNVKQKLIGLFYVCSHTEAKNKLTEKTASDNLITDCEKILDEKPTA